MHTLKVARPFEEDAEGKRSQKRPTEVIRMVDLSGVVRGKDGVKDDQRRMSMERWSILAQELQLRRETVAQRLFGICSAVDDDDY